MHRPGCDPDQLLMSDVRCDFCGAEWTDARPMVEGHRGACICGPCLSVAYAQAMRADATSAASAATTAAVDAAPCSLCRETRAEFMWKSPLENGAHACRRCIRQSAAVLQKDADSGWRRPEA